jgi:hypothetical protein
MLGRDTTIRGWMGLLRVCIHLCDGVVDVLHPAPARETAGKDRGLSET